MLIIGSTAAAQHMRLQRRPSDIDLMATPDEAAELLKLATWSKQSEKHPGKYMMLINYKRVEVDATSHLSRRLLTENDEYRNACVSHQMQLDLGKSFTVDVPKLSTLWAFKRSHAGFPINTEKTLGQLIGLSKAVIGTEFKETVYDEFLNIYEQFLIKQLQEETRARFGSKLKRITFDKPAKEFFKPAQGVRTYDHDSLHEATYRWHAPLYRENLVDPNKALVDMKLFNSRPFEYRLTMAQEEAVVIGLERFFVDNPEMDGETVYRKGMTKFVVDLCKGQFQNFVLDHLHLITTPMWDFMSKFRQAQAAGRLQLIES